VLEDESIEAVTTEAERSKFLAQLNDEEEWLYMEGENEPGSVFRWLAGSGRGREGPGGWWAKGKDVCTGLQKRCSMERAFEEGNCLGLGAEGVKGKGCLWFCG
jgi:hypothetical protein